MTPRQRTGLWAALGGALLLRVLTTVSLDGAPFYDVPIVDSAAYDAWGQRIAAGEILGDRVFYQDPLYPYGLGLFYAVFGRDLLAARLVQCAIGVFGLWMLFEATRRLLGYRAAMVALVIGALYKTFIFYDATLLKDFLAVVAVEAALLFWALNGKWKWLAFGAVLGIGTLARGNLLLVALAAAALLAVRREWKPAGLVVAGTLAAILPVTIRNAAVAGDFVLTTSQLGPNLYTGNNPENATGRYRPPSFVKAANPEFEESGFKAEAERLERRPMKASEVDAYWRGRAVDHIIHNFGTFLAATGRRLLMLLSSHEVPDDYNMYFLERFSWPLRMPLPIFGLVAPLAAAGIYMSWADRRRFAMLYAILAAYGFSILFFFVFARYRLPLVPVLIIFAAHAATRHADLREIPKAAHAIFLAACVLVNLPLPESVSGHRDFRAAHYNLGIYYTQNGRPAEAAREFEEAATLNPQYLQDPLFVRTLAEMCARSGRVKDALQHYERMAKLDPVSAEWPYQAGLIHQRNGLLSIAEPRLADAVRREPGHAAARVALAETLRQMRRFDEALRHLDPAAAPGEWTIPAKRAEIYRELSMLKEALAEEEAARRLRDQ